MNRILRLASRDLLSETRARQIAPVMVLFALSLVFLFTFTMPTGSLRAPAPVPQAGAVAAREITGTLLWATIFFSTIIGLGRGIAVDRESGAGEGLLLVPIDPAALFTAKLLANLAFLSATEVLVIPLYMLFAGIPFGLMVPGILLVALPVNIGLAAVGTIFGTASQYSESPSVILPLLVFPFALPVVLGGSTLTSTLLTSAGFAGEVRWFILLAVFDVVFLTIGAVTFEYVIQE